MKHLNLPVEFFAALVDSPPIYRLLWLEWLAEKSDLLNHPSFCEKLRYKNVPPEKIKECYAVGMRVLQGSNFFASTLPIKKPKAEVAENPVATEIIEYLNAKAGTTFKPKGKNIELINARLKDGHTKEDFIKVIDNKVAEWAQTEFEKFLRPITLFSLTHFENYLNSKNAKPSSKVGKLRDAVEQAQSRLFE